MVIGIAFERMEFSVLPMYPSQDKAEHAVERVLYQYQH
jgi:hypothetical protein